MWRERAVAPIDIGHGGSSYFGYQTFYLFLRFCHVLHPQKQVKLAQNPCFWRYVITQIIGVITNNMHSIQC